MIDHIKAIIQQYKAKPIGNQKEFAVFLPLIERDGQLHILFEVRGQSISQPGDTSFPGGKIEANEHPKTAAIRETIEELNVSPDQIEVFGPIDYIIRDWAIVYCFAGQIHQFNMDEFQRNEEVEHLFSVPLEFFINESPTYYPINIEERMSADFPFERIHRGKDYKFHRQKMLVPFYNLPKEYNDNTLWGMTAQLTHRFSQIITTDSKQISIK